MDELATEAADREEPLRWISVVHLMFMFFRRTGMTPPWFDKVAKQWVHLQDHQRPQVARPDVGTLSAAFCRHLRELLQAQEVAWISVDRRPQSSAIQVKVRTVACRVPNAQLDDVDRSFIHRLPGGVCGGRSVSWKAMVLH